MIKSRCSLVLLFAVGSGAGCDSETPTITDEQTTSDAILRSPYGLSRTGTVSFGGETGRCTATVLSNHWLLTSARCLLNQPASGITQVFNSDGSEGGLNVVFSDLTENYIYPGYSGGSFGGANDIGLVHLVGRGIIDVNIFANLFSDSRRPWGNGALGNTFMEGYGIGTNPGDNYTCSTGWSKTSRSYSAPTFDLGDVSATQDARHCPGDDGGFWGYFIGSTPVQYAVSSQRGLISLLDTGALVQGALPWIESTMRSRMYPVGIGVINNTIGGYATRRFYEQLLVGSITNSNGWCVEPRGSQVVLARCNGSTLQRWYYFPGGQLLNGSTATCVTENGIHGFATMVPCSGWWAQTFHFDHDVIYSGFSHSYCLDVLNSGQYDGAPMWTYECNGTSAQYLTFQF